MNVEKKMTYPMWQSNRVCKMSGGLDRKKYGCANTSIYEKNKHDPGARRIGESGWVYANFSQDQKKDATFVNLSHFS